MLKMEKKNYRLGIDLGATSLGWCMLELNEYDEPCGIINMGVRIFPDGRDAKSKEPLSVSRRSYRSQRRNLDRYLFRLRTLIKYFTENGFLPEEEQKRAEVFKMNPYFLRSKALNEKLSPAEFARALIHLAKHRGFKSNRKIMSNKATAYTKAIENLTNSLQETDSRTLGEYLWKKYQSTSEDQAHLREPIKFRYEINTENPNPIFPLREMVEQEFEAIWNSQARFYDFYTDKHKEEIKNIIFFQNPLKPQPKGKCQFIPTEDRAPKAHPFFQEYRILQDLNNLSLITVADFKSFELTTEQREILYNKLMTTNKLTYSQMRKMLFGKQAEDYKFNFEKNNRDAFQGNLTYSEIHHPGNKLIAEFWDSSNADLQNKIIELLISDLDDDDVISELLKLGINLELGTKFLNLHLPDGYCHLSIAAMQKILPFMRQGQKVSTACKSAGLEFSMEYDGTIYDEGNLPYYGEILKRETLALQRKTGDENADKYGKINNPTVHIALNQLRKLVNAICIRYGSPKMIILELGKEIKLGRKEKERIIESQNRNLKMNKQADEILASCSVPSNYENRLKVKLWLELGTNEIDRRCIYTGEQISIHDLFTPKIEIDHILPKSKTYDDSFANKILCLKSANQYKGERSPFEAFGESRDGYTWKDIVTRANSLPNNKKWRFQKNAMDKYEDNEEIIARMLNDTRYMSKVAMKYMFYVCSTNNVYSVTGMHTALLRKKWGLDSALSDDETKNRSDHRQHSIDAFVIALTTRSMVKNLANNIANSKQRFLENLDPPYPGFNYSEFKEMVQKINVSFKPDQINPEKLRLRNQTGGALTDETAYALVGTDPENPTYNLYSVRKPIGEISKKDVDNIASPVIKKQLNELVNQYDDKNFTIAVRNYGTNNNIKKVKLHLSMKPENMIPVYDKKGKPFKYLASGENLFAEVYIEDPTSEKPQWKIEIVNSYKAHQPDFIPEWKKIFPKGKKLMRVFKNDIISLDTPDGKREFRRVRKMSGNILYLRELHIAKKEKGKEDIGEQYGANKLCHLRARKAGIDILGRVFDPIVNEK